MDDMLKKMSDLQHAKFGAMNEFHTQRTASFLSELAKHFGDEVYEAAKELPTDCQGLMTWHMKRTAVWMEQLQNKFGPEVMEIINEKEKSERIRSGIETAQQSSGNTMEDIIPYFGGKENVIEQTEDGCLMRTQFCMLANAAKDAGIEDFVYHLHCCNDPCFAEGFNPELGCEVKKSMLNGDEYCEHYIYKK